MGRKNITKLWERGALPNELDDVASIDREIADLRLQANSLSKKRNVIVNRVAARQRYRERQKPDAAQNPTQAQGQALS